MLRIALVMADEMLLYKLARALRSVDIDILLQSTNGAEAIAQLRSMSLDVLVMDMALPGLDALGIMRELRVSPCAVLPAVVLLSAAPMPTFEALARSEGAACVLHRPINAAAFGELIKAIGPEARMRRNGANLADITDRLHRLGFRRTMGGTHYLARCIELAAQDERLLRCLTTGLYPAVAREFETTSDRVAHAIRRAIESAWSRGEIARQHRMFGNTIDERRGKPTAGEMIARMAQQIRTKEAEGEL